MRLMKRPTRSGRTLLQLVVELTFQESWTANQREARTCERDLMGTVNDFGRTCRCEQRVADHTRQ